MKPPLPEAELDALLVSATTMAQWNDEGDLYLRLIAEIRVLREAARAVTKGVEIYAVLGDELRRPLCLTGLVQVATGEKGEILVSDLRRLRALVPPA